MHCFFPKNFINFLSFCFILWFFSTSLSKYYIHYWWQLMTFNGSLFIRMSEQMVFFTINLIFLTLINIFQLQCRGFRNTKAEIWENERIISHNESTEKLKHHRFGQNYIWYSKAFVWPGHLVRILKSSLRLFISLSYTIFLPLSGFWKFVLM